MNELAPSLKKCRIEGNSLLLPKENLPDYAKIRSALLKAGATYKRNSFIFPSDAQAIVDRLIGGEKVNPKKEFQFFATPDHLADEMVELAEISAVNNILEPSAGDGAIVKAIQREVPVCRVWGYEAMEENRKKLEKITNFRLLGNDFLKCDTSFDKIIANPPFSKNQDITHIYHMYNCLRSGGRIVTICSKHYENAKRKKETEFRYWLDIVKAKVRELPIGTFKESGTNVATQLIIINKR